MKNRHWFLDHYPDGQNAEAPWRMVTNEDPEPGPRQILVRMMARQNRVKQYLQL